MTDFIQTTASRFHLDTGRIRFVLRTFVAAAIAMYIAIALGLEHPNWSVMGALSSSQPTRERIFLKGLLRAAGSVVGAIIGVLILLATDADQLLVIALLSIWVGLCVVGSIILRGLFSYFAVVSSFTTAMVVLLVSDNPDNVWALGMDRMLTSLVGVAVAWIIGALFAPRGGNPYSISSFSRSLSELFAHLAQNHKPQHAENHLFDLMKMEVRLNTEGDGSRKRNLQIRAFRRTLSAMLALTLYHGRKGKNVSDATAKLLIHMQQHLQDKGELKDVVGLLNNTAATAKLDDPTLAFYLRKLAIELRILTGSAEENRTSRIYLHHDWSTARIAFLRVLIAYWGLGLIWVLTGGEAAAYLLISATVMLSVFSSADEQLSMIKQAAIGQVIGVSVGLLCIGLLWPFVDSVWLAALPVVVLIFFGFIAWAHPRLTIICYDFLMSVMLLLNPWLYTDLDVKSALPIGMAIFCGPLIVWLLFRTLLPVDTKQKAQSIRRLIRHELEAMSRRYGKVDFRQREIWHARLYQRILRLAHLQHLSNKTIGHVATEGMAWFDIADSIAMLHSIVRNPNKPQRLVRAATLALRRLARLGKDAQGASRALEMVVVQLPDCRQDKATMQRAADFLSRHRKSLATNYPLDDEVLKSKV